MTDHSTSDEHLLLASAYVDGELTADERARAEADPVVMSMVEELRGVRRQLAVASPPDDPRRDAAIVAALAAALPIPSIAARRRARWMAPVAAAAAALVLVVGGIVVLRAGDDGEDQASLEVAGRAQLEDDDAATGAASAPPAVAPRELATAGTAAEGESADEEAESTEAPVAPSPAQDQAAAGTIAAASAIVLVTEDDLRAFVAPPAAGESSATSEARCRPDDRFLGVAQVQVVDGTVDVEVYEVADPAERVAVDRQTCDVVLRASP